MIAETPESEQRAALGDEKEIVRLANEIKRRKREARRAELEAQRRTESDADSWRGEPEWTDEERGLSSSSATATPSTSATASTRR